MNVIRRLTRFSLVVLLGVSAVGCCIAPPFGWGHGQRGYGERIQADPMSGHSRGGESSRMGSDGQRR